MPTASTRTRPTGSAASSASARKALGTLERHRRRIARAAADARRTDRPAAEPGSVRRGRGAGSRAAAQRPPPVPEAHRRLDRLLGRRGKSASPRASRRPATSTCRRRSSACFVKLNNELLRFASPRPRDWSASTWPASRRSRPIWPCSKAPAARRSRACSPTRTSRTHTASTTGTNGDTFEPAGRGPDGEQAAGRGRRADRVGDAQDDVRGPDEPAGGCGHRRRRRRGRSCSAARRKAPTALPGELYGTRVVRSAQVSNTRAKGARHRTSPTSCSATSRTGSWPEWA